MTRITKVGASSRRRSKAAAGEWPLQDAKARFSELVRRARSDGPQRVTVHGREEVVVVASEEFRRLKGDRSGRTLVEAMQASPFREIELTRPPGKMPVSKVKF